MNQNAYIPPEITEGEAERLEELYGLRLLDTASELRFDRYTSLVASVFKFPVVLISLLDRDRQWFKSRLGLSRPSVRGIFPSVAIPLTMIP